MTINRFHKVHLITLRVRIHLEAKLINWPTQAEKSYMKRWVLPFEPWRLSSNCSTNCLYKLGESIASLMLLCIAMCICRSTHSAYVDICWHACLKAIDISRRTHSKVFIIYLQACNMTWQITPTFQSSMQY